MAADRTNLTDAASSAGGGGKDIAVIGSSNMDLITYITRMPSEGETVEAPDFAMGFGGKGANQAVSASRLGSRVLMLTRVGNDLFAESTIENYRRNGIDTTHVLSTEAASGVAPIFVDEESRNSILIVKGANALLFADLIPRYIEYGFKWGESQVEMENNSGVQGQWSALDHTLHKRRRCYRKELTDMPAQ